MNREPPHIDVPEWVWRLTCIAVGVVLMAAGVVFIAGGG